MTASRTLSLRRRLALFEGVVAEFIPVVGTYIAGALPVLVALLYG